MGLNKFRKPLPVVILCLALLIVGDRSTLPDLCFSLSHRSKVLRLMFNILTSVLRSPRFTASSALAKVITVGAGIGVLGCSFLPTIRPNSLRKAIRPSGRGQGIRLRLQAHICTTADYALKTSLHFKLV